MGAIWEPVNSKFVNRLHLDQIQSLVVKIEESTQALRNQLKIADAKCSALQKERWSTFKKNHC
jgi:hypothetical protein